jgi:hypothetical protein
MQRAVGNSNAPHPELEAQLQEEIAKIEPKVVEGTVTIEEANHLHSLEARAHGHTEKGGITSIAQSVAAKRERQLSLSSGSSSTGSRSRANSKTSPQEQSHRDKEANLRQASLSDQTNIAQQDHDVNDKLAGMTLENKKKKESESVVQEGSPSPGKKSVAAAKPVGSMHKRQSSQTVEVN